MPLVRIICCRWHRSSLTQRRADASMLRPYGPVVTYGQAGPGSAGLASWGEGMGSSESLSEEARPWQMSPEMRKFKTNICCSPGPIFLSPPVTPPEGNYNLAQKLMFKTTRQGKYLRAGESMAASSGFRRPGLSRKKILRRSPLAPSNVPVCNAPPTQQRLATEKDPGFLRLLFWEVPSLRSLGALATTGHGAMDRLRRSWMRPRRRVSRWQ